MSDERCPDGRPHRRMITTELRELSPYLVGVCKRENCGDVKRYHKAPHLDRKPWINWEAEKVGRAVQL